MPSFVYMIQNIKNRKIYFGMTTGTVESRWKQHCYDASRGSKMAIHAAIRKYKPERFRVSTIVKTDDVEYAFLAEEILIDFFGTVGEGGYNMIPGGRGGRRRSIVIEGTRYETISAAALKYGVQIGVLSGRLKCGDTPEEAVGLTPRVYRGKEISLNGVTYKSFSDIARRHNVSYATFKHRYNISGWTLEQSLGIDRKPDFRSNSGNRKKVFFDGESLLITEAAKKYGFSRGYALKLAKKMGCDHQRAIEIIIERKAAKSK